jgi:hypothetical protein
MLSNENGNINRLIEKFEEISLDIRPFIQDRGLTRY